MRKFTLKATSGGRTETCTLPAFGTNSAGPSSGSQPGLVIFSARPSYWPTRTSTRLVRSGFVAAAS